MTGAHGSSLALSQNPLLAQLGYPPDARLVIFHADDVGMCHGSNVAFWELAAAGIVQTGSVMVPCPWSQEILERAAADPLLDLGVHFTLNSEWSGYRWGPLSTRDRASGLIDDEGWFWHRPPMLAERLNPAATMAEMDAQIEHAVAAGLDLTHLDAHMGAAMMGSLVQHYIESGFRHRVPVLMPRLLDEGTRGIVGSSMSEARWADFTGALEKRGMPLVDTFRITPGYDVEGGEGGRAELYEKILRELPSGVTYFSLHPNAPGDIEAIVPDRAHWRTFEHAYFQSQQVRDLLIAEGIIPIGYRAIRAIMRM